MSRGASIAAVDFLPITRFTQVSLSPRVRNLLEVVYQAAWPIVNGALELTLDDLDHELYARAERVVDATDQNRCFESLREIRRRRAEFLLTCREACQRSVLALVDAHIPVESLHQAKDSDGTVSIPSNAALDEDEGSVLVDIAASAELRAGAALQGLAYRLGVIAGSGPIELEAIALGPRAICAAICRAGLAFNVVPDHRITLYRLLERTLFADPGRLYDAINRSLIEHRVFAHLHLSPPKSAALPEAKTAAPEPALASVELPTPEPAAAIPAAVPAPAADASSAEPSRLVQSPGRASQEVPLDARFFANLRELLGARRRPLVAAEATTEQGRPVATKAELHGVLSLLQAQPPMPVLVGGKWVNRTLSHIKQDMLNQLRSLREGASPRLSDEDTDTLEMVGLLFDWLLVNQKPNSMMHGLVSRLQVPLLKVALRDRNFFTRRSHPARVLLNSLADTLSYWIEDEDSDRAFIEKLHQLSERVVREYDDDLAAFDRVNDDLSQFLGALQKKAEVAERRHGEAAKGREKLDLARAAAQEAVQHCMAVSTPPDAIRELLENAWADALALSLLRQGIDHPKTLERLDLVTRLLAAFAPERSLIERRQLLQELQMALEDGLVVIGFHEGSIGKVWSDLNHLIEAQHEHARLTASQAITELIKQKPRLGGEASAAVSAIAPQGSNVGPPGAKELAAVERIKQLPFGTWFEFAAQPAGAMVRRKLCWFSPVTGRCLFLNVRGAKTDERSIDALARELALGTARVVETTADNAIDRAWRGIAAVLKDGAVGAGRSIGPRPL